MKFTLTVTVSALALIAGSTAAWAADDVTSAKHSPPISADAKATNACLNAFMARIFPAGAVRVRTVVPSGGTQVFSEGAGSIVADYGAMQVTMTVNLVRNDDLLAKSVCTVSKHAQVLNLSIGITDPGKLAGLTLKDVKVAMVSR
jgi:hypothetical protein